MRCGATLTWCIHESIDYSVRFHPVGTWPNALQKRQTLFCYEKKFGLQIVWQLLWTPTRYTWAACFLTQPPTHQPIHFLFCSLSIMISFIFVEIILFIPGGKVKFSILENLRLRLEAAEGLCRFSECGLMLWCKGFWGKYKMHLAEFRRTSF